MSGDWLFKWRAWSGLQCWVRPPGSSLGSEPETGLSGSIKQLNDHVYEVCKPPFGQRPSVEIVFFHGLQLESINEPHIGTWLSRGKSTLWLTWLSEEHSNARILTVSYDASPKRTHERGRAGMFVTCENLISCLTDSRAALGDDGCPVILVGHCLGGLVMKEVLVKAQFMLSRNTYQESIRNFLTSVKAIFFYATPHHGSHLPNTSRGFLKGPLFNYTTILNEDTARANQHFQQIRQSYKWISRGVGENQVVKLGNFTGLIVAEASSRFDVDAYCTIDDANHFDVCRPKSIACRSYQFLSDLIADVLQEDKKAVYSSSCLHPQTVGLKGPLDNIEKKLFNGDCLLQRFGIVGIGGIGKTMLAKCLFDQISGRFDYGCFVREVKRLMGGWETTEQLHKIIMEKLTRKGRLVDRAFRWSALKRKRVLIVLDDVESEFHTRVMTEEDGFSEDSVVIVTSRNKRFLKPQDFTIYEMETLGCEDSRKLLCLHAFKRELAPTEFGEHVTKVADLCGGLPLALEVAGGYLYNQEEAIWDDACKMLVEVHSIGGSSLEEDRLWSILKKSYHSLGRVEQDMFLDIATCLEGEFAVDVKNMWKFRGWPYVNAGWQNLLDRCLVKLIEPQHKRMHERLSGNEAIRISMHELLRNLGRERACSRDVENRGHVRVFEVRKANELLNQAMQDCTVEILKLKLQGYESLDMRVLRGLTDLRVLWLSGTEERSDRRRLDAFEDPFFERSSRLFVMTITKPWKTIVTIYQQLVPSRIFPPQLAYVRMFQADTLKVQQISKIWALRCLVLDYPTIGQLPRSLCQLRQLEHLEIISCYSLTAIPAEIGLLHSLRFLKLDHCFSLEVFPDSIADLRALEVLNIHHCPILMVPLACLRNLPVLKDLNVRTCVVESWYELRITCGGSNGFLLYLKSIKFGDFHCLKDVHGVGVHVWDESLRNSPYFCDIGRLFESCEQMRQLRRLEIKFLFGKNSNLNLKCFLALEELHVNGNARSESRLWTKVRNLPDSIGSLLKLRLLVIQDLFDLAILPDALGQLQSLQTLVVHGCPSLNCFPESIGQLVTLQKLEIVKCKALTTLPNSTGKVHSLEILTIDGCPSMISLPESVWQLTALRKLTITNCQSLKSTSNTTWKLQALDNVELDLHSPNNSSTPTLKILGDRILQGFLKIFGDHIVHVFDPVPRSTTAVSFGTELLDAAIIGQLPALRCLKLRDYSSRRLPHALRFIHSLEQLTVHYQSVTDLEPVWQLPKLERLRLEHCRSVTDLGPVKDLQALTHLDLIGLNIATLPASVGHLGALKHLLIRDCVSLKELPKSVGHLGALECLIIKNCDRFEELPESVGHLAALEYLEIHGCGAVADLPESIGQLRVLKTLVVRYCCNLAKLPQSLHQVRLLKHLEIEMCRNLMDLTENIGELRALTTLIVRSCSKLPKLPESINQLRALKYLEVASCGMSVNLPESIGRLQNLQCLVIEDFERLEAIPNFVGQLQVLQVLRIKWCHNLVTLPQFVGQLGALQLMEICSCAKMASLPESFGQLARLVIDNCPDLEAWRPTLQQVGRLQQLEFSTYALYSALKGNEDEQHTTTVFYPRDLRQLSAEKKSLREFAAMRSRADHGA